MMNLLMIKSGKRMKPSLLGEETGMGEQMANFHLERTMTDFRQQQWSPRLCTFLGNNRRNAAA